MDTWFKILDELTAVTQSRRLEERIHEDILVKAEQFTKKNAKDFTDGIELLGKLMIAYADYTAKHGKFGDMFGDFLIQTNQCYGRPGQFLTPMNVVDFMTKITLGDKLNEKPLLIMDPAAGTGRFMLGTAKHFAEKFGQLNFIFFNIDIEYKVYTYCSLNAILNGIPAVMVWGDSLACKYREGVCTIPIGTIAMWKILNEEHITQVMNRFAQYPKETAKLQIKEATKPFEVTVSAKVTVATSKTVAAEMKQLTLLDFKPKKVKK